MKDSSTIIVHSYRCVVGLYQKWVFSGFDKDELKYLKERK